MTQPAILRHAPTRPETPAAAETYFQEVARRLDSESSLQSVRWIEALARGHEAFRRTACLNLDTREGLMSQRCRALLRGDVGAPRHALRSHGGCSSEFVEEMEAILVGFARRLFGAAHVEWRAATLAEARRAVVTALAQPHEVVVTVDGVGPDSLGPDHPRTLTLPQGPDFLPDLARLEAVAQRVQPSVIVVGGASAVRAQPIAELRAIADAVGARLVFNADQLGVLISAGELDRPLDAGADAVILSAAGAMGGPGGALALTEDAALAARIADRLGGQAQQDETRYAALAVALAEVQAFGGSLAAQATANARALGEGLGRNGLQPLGEPGWRTDTHQVFARAPRSPERIEADCDVAGVRLGLCTAPGEAGGRRISALRMGVHELTRRGMREAEMSEVARLVAALALDEGDPDRHISCVTDLLAAFSNLPFSFDSAQ